MAFFSLTMVVDLLRLPCNIFEKLSPLEGFHEWNVIYQRLVRWKCHPKILQFRFESSFDNL